MPLMNIVELYFTKKKKNLLFKKTSNLNSKIKEYFIITGTYKCDKVFKFYFFYFSIQGMK